MSTLTNFKMKLWAYDIKPRIGYVVARIQCAFCRTRKQIHNTSQGTISCKQFLKDYGWCN